MEVVDRVGQGHSTFSLTDLHKLFNEQGYSDYIVVYLRLITSGQLQRDSDFYQHFIEGDRTVADFCHQVSLKEFCLLSMYFSPSLHSVPQFIW
jgi:ubiquitin thioesterase protein OTUB1